jgi:hypothetical protein
MKTHSSYLLIALASVALAGCADDEPPAPEDITGVSLACNALRAARISKPASSAMHSSK